MIKDPETLRRFEDSLAKGEKLPFAKALQIYEAMWHEGRALGVLPPRDPMEGIEADIKLARILNSCSKKSSPE